VGDAVRAWKLAVLAFAILVGILAAQCGAAAAAPDNADNADIDSVDTEAGYDGRISVVIPTHDRASQLEGAIASVLASPLILSPAQVIVVDDDSHDRTPQLVRRLGVRYLRVAGHSAARSRNAGWFQARTEYVTFLDDDDAWLPGNMELQLAALDARADAGYAYGIAQCASEDLEPLPATWPAPPLVSGRAPGQLLQHIPQLGVVLFRREALEQVGGFDPQVHYWEDGDLMVRVAALRDIVAVDRVGMLYRLRRASRQRCNYFWPLRNVVRWRPKLEGIARTDRLRFHLATRGLFFGRFVEDAAASAAEGQRWDAMVCAARATWISPLHAVRHPHWLLTSLMRN
jgi:glycosyltransferase involved in cell wall biosynthesis